MCRQVEMLRRIHRCQGQIGICDIQNLLTEP
jgi:hypothetical protein